ncbi:MAG: HAMP domain-containing histidine kinase [Actinobacteria bacterium]|nr:HAMP domain-containing histidine kinase [Actinomycetota bacterium]
MRLQVAAFVTLAGAVASFLAALAFGVGAKDGLMIVGLAAGAALAVGVVGAVVLQQARGHSIAVQSGIVTLTSVIAVPAAMVAASGALFSVSHENAALVAILIVSGTLGVLISLALGARIDADRRRLIEATRKLAGGGAVSIEMPETDEFAEVARELEQMSVQLGEAQSRERSLDESRRELVAWISHDLRTPLARLRAVVEALEDRIAENPETIRSYYRTLDLETIRLSRLIDDLFELSRINSGTLELQLESMPLAELVSDVVASARELAEQKGVQLEIRIDAQPRALISPSHVERALGNLLDNAIRHTASGGTIGVVVDDSPLSAKVMVMDGCGGIPSAQLARLIDPSREPPELHGSSTRPGLGLIIARGLVEAHLGELSISNAGEGCCFTIELPLQPVAAAANR